MAKRYEETVAGKVATMLGKTRFLAHTVVLLCCVTANAGASDNATASQALSDAGWKLIWSDEFDQGKIDPAKWEHEVDCSGGGNNEAQCYTDRAQNSFVDDQGILHIVAREERFSGPAHPRGSPDYRADDRSAVRDYTSARLRTIDRLDFKYGRIEVRARLPAGQGTWPAIWMLPTDGVYGGWPSSGEIDIMEAVNLDDVADEHSIHGTLHYGLKWPQWSVAGADYHIEGSATREFRTYTLEWEADEMRWFVDDVHYQTQTSAGWYNYIWGGQEKGFEVATPRAPFDQKFHLLLNLAIGGHAPGAADTGWREDREFLIDYVRVYQCQADPESGVGCAYGAEHQDDASITFTRDTGAPEVRRFTIFDDGPATLSFESGDRSIENRLVLKNQSPNADTVNVKTPDLGDSRGRVIDIEFNGAGQVALASANMQEMVGIADGFRLKGGQAWSNFGTIEFDLYIDHIDAGTSLEARLGGQSAIVGQVTIEAGDSAGWQPVAIRIADLIESSRDNGAELDLSRLDYLFALASRGNGKARVRVDNVRLTCAVNSNAKSWQPSPYCSIEPVLARDSITGDSDIFIDQITRWSLADCCGGSTADIIDDDLEPDRGKVVEFRFLSDETVVMFQSDAPIDMSALAGGSLEFDLVIVANPDNPAQGNPWLVSASCGHPCRAGDFSLAASKEAATPVIGKWQRYSFALDELASGGLDLRKVTSPLVIYPRWGNQQGAIFRVDNAVLKAPVKGAIKLSD